MKYGESVGSPPNSPNGSWGILKVQPNPVAPQGAAQPWPGARPQCHDKRVFAPVTRRFNNV